eukprot:m.312304 g.312304  ORF g.312304 m.312304 type:complete len:397 (+) comp20238_c0_seq9:270-1460(+)
MGMKKKLMMQAAAAAAAAEGGGDGFDGPESNIKDDPLWKIQSELLAADDLSSEMDLLFHPATTRNQGSSEGSGAPSKYKWATSLDTQFEFDFKSATPKEDITDIKWRTGIKGIMRSEAGAEGVFFVETDAGAVVLKGSRSMGAEIYSCLLGTKLGIFCPRWRLIPLKSSEGSAMLAGLSEKDTSGRVRVNLAAMQNILLKAYLPGTNFGSLDVARTTEIFGVEGHLSPNGVKRLREIGRILALDVLCNNGDRLPLIWDNRGNPGNIMMAKGVGKAVSIDSQIQPIDKEAHPDQFQVYMDKVKDLIRGLKQDGSSKELPQFATVRSKIKEFTQHDVGTQGSIELQRGFLEVLENKAGINITADVLQQWRDALASYTPAMVGLSCADPAFVMAVWDLF